jgi:Ni,Fe-hydrogenase III small subunit/ferredoxin
MSPWMTRGLTKGVLTTRYPHLRPQEPSGLRTAVEVRGQSRIAPGVLQALCPTGAIAADGSSIPTLDHGRCILCGNCVAADPEAFAWSDTLEVAEWAPRSPHFAQQAQQATKSSPQRSRLAHSAAIRHIDTGSDGAEEWELKALWNPYYDAARLGLTLTASPRHADVLIVTGCGAPGMREPLRATVEAMPDPKVIVAVGTDAISGGLFGPGVLELVPVDVVVPGSPPSPLAILDGILRAIGRSR